MKTIRAATLLPALAACLAGALASLASAPASATATRPNGPSRLLVGEWQGRSLCVTTTRPACTDETVRFRVRKDDATGDGFHITADKLVDGKFQDMGELECRFEPSRQQLICPMAGGQWQLRWDGDALFGALLEQGGMFRTVYVHRAAAAGPSRAPRPAR